ncbi:MAG: hypothetical protein FJX47_13505 [Alphaproteobacteria bacterium]|nr:hypothetical protein [Alphaproteobacteria bacterium]
MVRIAFSVWVLQDYEWRFDARFPQARQEEALRKARTFFLLKEAIQAVVVLEEHYDDAGILVFRKAAMERTRVSPLPTIPGGPEATSDLALPDAETTFAPEEETRERDATDPTPRRGGGGSGEIEIADRAEAAGESIETSSPARPKPAFGTTGRKAMRKAVAIAREVSAGFGAALIFLLAVLALAFGLSSLELWEVDRPLIRFLGAVALALILVGGAAFVARRFGRALIAGARSRAAALRDQGAEVLAFFADYPKGLALAVEELLTRERSVDLSRKTLMVPALLGGAMTVWLGYLLVTAILRHIEAGDIGERALPLGVLGGMALACLATTVWFWRLMAPERTLGPVASQLADTPPEALAAALAAADDADATVFRDARDVLFLVHDLLVAFSRRQTGFQWTPASRQALRVFVVGATERYCTDERRAPAHTALVVAKVLGNVGQGKAEAMGFLAELPRLASEPTLRQAFDRGRACMDGWIKAGRKMVPDAAGFADSLGAAG